MSDVQNFAYLLGKGVPAQLALGIIQAGLQEMRERRALAEEIWPPDADVVEVEDE